MRIPVKGFDVRIKLFEGVGELASAAIDLDDFSIRSDEDHLRNAFDRVVVV